MVGEFSVAAVVTADEEATVVVFRCPASCWALELILSLRGLVGPLAGGELRWVGATVTNVTADRLRKTANERGKNNVDLPLSLCAESCSGERRTGMGIRIRTSQ